MVLGSCCIATHLFGYAASETAPCIKEFAALDDAPSHSPGCITYVTHMSCVSNSRTIWNHEPYNGKYHQIFLDGLSDACG
jgi:hypothetical protein